MSITLGSAWRRDNCGCALSKWWVILCLSCGVLPQAQANQIDLPGAGCGGSGSIYLWV